MQTTLLGLVVARERVSALATSALPGAPVRRVAERRPAPRLRRRP